MPRQTFFGKEIRRDIRETQVTQIYNILAGEIASGRWEINSRFPSVTQLVGESGLSRGSIQKVLARLENDGLIATESRRGTFVISLDPPSKPTPVAEEVSEPDPETASVPSSPVSETPFAEDAPALAEVSYRTSSPDGDNPPIPEPAEPSAAAAPPAEASTSDPPPLPLFSDPFSSSGSDSSKDSKGTAARIGIALTRRDARIQSDPASAPDSLLEALLEALKDFGYRSSVSFVEPTPDWEVLADDGGPFDDAVDGIIALGSGGFVDFTHPPSGRCPVVFVSTADSRSHPSVSCDFALGAYRATRDLISMGHSRIIVCPETDVRTTKGEAFLSGHREAMGRVGLPVDEDAISLAQGLQNGDFSSLRQFLNQFRNATAILCGNPKRAAEIIALCDAIGVEIPADLSVASAGHSPMRDDLSGGTVTGFEFPPARFAHAILTILDEIIHTGSSQFSQVKVPPEMIAGNSTAPPRRIQS